MKEIILDTKNTETIELLHQQIAKLLNFPDYYGANLDALYDMLSGEIELPVKIIWKNFNEIQKKIGKKADEFKKVLLEFSKDENSFQLDMR